VASRWHWTVHLPPLLSHRLSKNSHCSFFNLRPKTLAPPQHSCACNTPAVAWASMSSLTIHPFPAPGSAPCFIIDHALKH